MRVRIDNAKHDTNRYTILSNLALDVLRKYFKEYFSGINYESDDWLFPGQNKVEHINVKTIKSTIIKYLVDKFFYVYGFKFIKGTSIGIIIQLFY